MQSMFTSIARPSTSRALLAASSRRAFHTGKPSAAAVVADKTAQIHEYVPGGPVLRGGVNDAHKFPEPHKSHGSYHWQFERLLSVALIPITISTFAVAPSAHPILDGVLGASLIIHSHIGFDSCLVDYLHERKFPRVGPAASWALRAATVGALFGVYEFNTNDVGLTELIRKTWNA
ncbi:Succinate dehydrogenase membrane anchor subunit and related proteins [Phaffia rhodozyma]|uniref:Succinate dehydrogenase [ubiquinone] cytochrome b small subunit n=1 Tax=Phaffia rhodozyma TaxID=264483 RepID=A0A0F7SGB2_PHARH|nr:Succinate dehydrogenase membrane anchor subunit and related proteins [Phaffia rhodozyma]